MCATKTRRHKKNRRALVALWQNHPPSCLRALAGRWKSTPSRGGRYSSRRLRALCAFLAFFVVSSSFLNHKGHEGLHKVHGTVYSSRRLSALSANGSQWPIGTKKGLTKKGKAFLYLYPCGTQFLLR